MQITEYFLNRNANLHSNIELATFGRCGCGPFSLIFGFNPLLMKYLLQLTLAAALLVAGCNSSPEPENVAPEVSAEAQQASANAVEEAKLLMNFDHPEMGGQDYEGAIAALTKAVEHDPNNEFAYLLRATCNGRLSRPKMALADLDIAIQLDPEFHAAIRNRAGLKFQLQDYAGSEADYTRLIELRPDDGVAFYNRAAVRGAMDNPHACKDIERAIELGQIDTTDILYERYCLQ